MKIALIRPLRLTLGAGALGAAVLFAATGMSASVTPAALAATAPTPTPTHSYPPEPANVPGTVYVSCPAHGTAPLPCGPDVIYSAGPTGGNTSSVTHCGFCYTGWMAVQLLGHRGGMLRFNNVMAPVAGSYILHWYYTNGDNAGDHTCGGTVPPDPRGGFYGGCRPGIINVNGTPQGPVYQFPSTAPVGTLMWDYIKIFDTPVTLNQGANTIEIYSNTTDAVDVEQFILDPASGTPTPSPSPCTAAPDAPTNVSGTANGGGQLTLSWTAPTSCAPVIAYAIYIYGSDASAQMQETAGGSFMVSGLTPNTYYTATITAYSMNGWSAWSNWGSWVPAS